jgi:ABC-type sugar transport system ATPase subunit
MSDRVIVLGSGRVVDEFRRGEGDEIRILEAVALAGVSVAGEAAKQ